MVQLARAAGCHVIATVGSEEKARAVRALGAHRAINYREESVKEVLRAEYAGGVDVVWESIGGEMFDTCVNALAPCGRLIVIGAMSQYQAPGGWKPLPHTGLPDKLLARSATVVGFFLIQYRHRFRAHLRRLVRAWEAGELHVSMDTRRFVGAGSVADAVEWLQSGKSTGKVRGGELFMARVCATMELAWG